VVIWWLDGGNTVECGLDVSLVMNGEVGA